MHALELSNVKKIYDGGVEALTGIDLSVKEGEFFALLGPNGAGKSTTIGIISSLVVKTSGEVAVFGADLGKHPEAVKASIGLVPQEFNFNMFEPVLQIVMNQAGYYGIPRKLAYQRAEKYLKKLDLWHKRGVCGRALSGGLKRRLMIARALIHEPQLLILDEPTAGVDIEIRRSMWQFLQELNAAGKTIILTTHYLEEAETLCNQIAIINQGKIIENRPTKELLSRLAIETFVFDVKSPLTEPLDVAPFTLRVKDQNTLEVDVPKSVSMNEVFVALSDHNIQVSSLRNKSNRLEELFLSLTESS